MSWICGASCFLFCPSLKKGVLIMVTFPLGTCARLLGIHPKTLRHWLKAANLPLFFHPTDARIRCVAEEYLLEVARLHRRPLPDLTSAAGLSGHAAPGLREEQAKPLPAHEAAPAHWAAALSAPSAALAELLQQLSQVHIQLATLQHQLTGLTLAFLQERTGHVAHQLEQRLPSLEGSVPQSRESLLAFSQTNRAGLLAPSPAPAHRPLPAEVRARSRVTALIE
jgi:hypothetical protein